MSRLGPVIMSVAGDAFIQPAQIASVIWVGSTTAGDTVELRERDTNGVLWKCRTDGTNTYLGKTFGPNGQPAPGGFKLSQISAGEVLIYLKEA